MVASFKKDRKFNLIMFCMILLIFGIAAFYLGTVREELKQNAVFSMEQDTQLISAALSGADGGEDEIRCLLQLDFFGEELYGILCAEDASLIAAEFSYGESKSDGKLADILAAMGVTEETELEFEEQFARADASVFEFDTEDGTAMACIAPVEDTEQKVILIVPAESFESVLVRNSKREALVIFWAAVVLFLILYHIRRNARKKRDLLLREKNETIQNFEQIIMTTASNTYVNIRRVNLEDGTSDCLSFCDHHIQQKDMGSWTDWLEEQRSNIHPDDYDKVHFLLELDNLRRMKTGSEHRISYRSFRKNEEGYFNTYTTNFSIAETEGKRTAMLNTIDSTSVVLSEMRQKKILTSIASIYVTVYVFDLKNDTSQCFQRSDFIASIVQGRSTNMREVLQETMRKSTDEHFLDSVKEFINFETLDERMKGTNTITLEFIGKNSGWCRGRFIAVDYDEEGKLWHVLWLVENIDAETRRTNQLLYLSETDLMTGLHNRGCGERLIKEYVAANRQGMFCLLDVDKFKQVNDRYGHGAGDKVLIEVAKCIKEAFHDGDILMRLGGDEFAVFAIGVTEQKWGIPLIESLFQKVDEIKIPGAEEHKITVSLGAAIKLDGDGMDFESLYKNADSGTYQSKKKTGSAYTFFGGETCVFQGK